MQESREGLSLPPCQTSGLDVGFLAGSKGGATSPPVHHITHQVNHCHHHLSLRRHYCQATPLHHSLSSLPSSLSVITPDQFNVIFTFSIFTTSHFFAINHLIMNYHQRSPLLSSSLPLPPCHQYFVLLLVTSHASSHDSCTLAIITCHG